MLRAQLRPFRLHYFPRLRSTNLHAAVMRKSHRLFAPAVVLTSNQMAGRGRGSNTWFSEAGSLTVTFALPISESEPAHQLPLIAGLAARAACAEITQTPDILLKWPNDLLINGKKLGGLLCQRIDKADLVGIGINVNTRLSSAPRAFRSQITSLQKIARRSIDINAVLLSLARHLRQVLRQRGQNTFAAFVNEYRRYDALIGRRIEVLGDNGDRPLIGMCQGIDASGRLLLRSRSQTHRIIAGHVISRSFNSLRKNADII
ncbi:MAG TPA: biotin--[acetyl-CoA-carboxylase] ligase [Tepidisphaeraceae bacterium]|nr:biotin--[acetyl-CoA-carboxylase] ligase [Tepidisphaeraceae bacterium]